MTWTAPVPPPLVDGPLVGADRPILEGFLAWQRSTLLTICSGLTGEQLAQPSIPPSTLTLLGLVRHLAKVERTWFRIRAAGEPIEPLYDPALGKDHDFDALDPARTPSVAGGVIVWASPPCLRAPDAAPGHRPRHRPLRELSGSLTGPPPRQAVVRVSRPETWRA